MCLCSFMTIFVYSATQEQDVPAQDNTFTEGEWSLTLVNRPFYLNQSREKSHQFSSRI